MGVIKLVPIESFLLFQFPFDGREDRLEILPACEQVLLSFGVLLQDLQLLLPLQELALVLLS